MDFIKRSLLSVCYLLIAEFHFPKGQSIAVIGVFKCGTYSLIKMLDDIYPNVHALQGESRFFSRFYNKGIESYVKSLPLMECPHDIIIEKSPKYFSHTKAPSRIYKDSPKSKLILIVCDPVRRVISHFVQRKTIVLISNRTSLAEYLTLPNGELDDRKVHTGLNKVLKFSQYAQHIKPWLSLFPRKQILIINGESLVANPYVEIVKAEKFLNLSNLVRKTTFVKNATGFPCWISYKGRNRIDKRGKGRKHPETIGEVKVMVDKLREYFIPRNKEFFNLTGVQFPWPMDKA